MARTQRNYTDRTIKVLFASSGNQCAFPTCSNRIIEPATKYSRAHVLAQICHIAPAGGKGPRADVTAEVTNRNEEENLILLCPTCHSRVDGQYESYPPAMLRAWKDRHEAIVMEIAGQPFLTISASIRRPQSELDKEITALERRLRRTRHYGEGDGVAQAKQLGGRLTRGDLAEASAHVRAQALGWCARCLAMTEHARLAEDMVLVAESLAPAESTEVARAFLKLANGDRDGALRDVRNIQSATGRTAQFIIAAHEIAAADALAWFDKSGSDLSDLDSDGKLAYLARCTEAEAWGAMERAALALSEADFDLTPTLLHFAAMVHLLPSVPVDLRRLIALQPPFDGLHFRLSSDQSEVERRRIARKLFEQSAAVATELGCRNAASTASYYAMWIVLRDPEFGEGGRVRLAESLRTPGQALWSVPLALQLDLSIDIPAVEREIDRRVAQFRYTDIEAATARLALVFRQATPFEAFRYLDQYRAEMFEVLEPLSIKSIEIELLAQADRVSEAIETLKASASLFSDSKYARLEQIIAEASAGKMLEVAEADFLKDETTPNLASLVMSLEGQGANPKLLQYATMLFDRTRAIVDAERVALILSVTNDTVKIEEFLAREEAFVEQSLALRATRAWLWFGKGLLRDAARELADIRRQRDNVNDRMLAINLALTSGAWDDINAVLEAEFSDRHERTPQQLLSRASLAALIGSARLKDFLFEAAAQAGDDAHVLVSAYCLATEVGMENDDAVTDWLARAAALSGEKGPIQRRTLADIVAMKPEWDRREEDAWANVRAGEWPMFLAGQVLHRSLIDMQLRPLIRNQRQMDIRRRSWVPLFSGARQPQRARFETICFDTTALLTLAFLDVLPLVFRALGKVVIPHTTLSWLAQERKAAVFHQPSRVVQAHRIRNLLARGDLKRFEPDRLTIPALFDEVGRDLAEMIQSARPTSQDDLKQCLVVRSLPVHKIASLGGEEADLSEYRGRICSCRTLVSHLSAHGLLTRSQEAKAHAYLGLQEAERHDEPTIETEAQVLLDSVSITYLDHLGLLGLIKDAGLTACIASSSIEEADALIDYEDIADQVVGKIDAMRSAIAQAFAEDRVMVAPLDSPRFEDEDFARIPTLNAMALADQFEAIVVDDRAINKHGWENGQDRQTSLLTSFDILQILREDKHLMEDAWHDCLSKLRKGNVLFAPVLQADLESSLDRALVSSGSMIETGELRVLRESILAIQLSGSLTVPAEGFWLDHMTKSIIGAIHTSWRKFDRTKARAVSNWLFQFLDLRSWAGSFDHAAARDVMEFGSVALLPQMCMALLDHGTLTMKQLSEFHLWLTDDVLGPLAVQEPDAIAWLAERVREIVDNAALTWVGDLV